MIVTIQTLSRTAYFIQTTLIPHNIFSLHKPYRPTNFLFCTIQSDVTIRSLNRVLGCISIILEVKSHEKQTKRARFVKKTGGCG